MAALSAPSASARLQAALTAGTGPAPEDVEVLIARSAVEPDFFVRDMLTWALVRHDASRTVRPLMAELASETPQARSQSLHTLSKIGDGRAWPAITTDLLQDTDDEVARAAWRAAAALVPEGHEAALAETLSTQFARGDREVQRSLSRALAAIGDEAASVVARAQESADPDVRAHAIATARLLHDPDEDFDAAIAEARRTVALRDAPAAER
ncbi:HEAT repeat protein [Microbacterium resistens]|uniref:HEAT repeat protein n=1 Tax=Microbacterium resistens TaxID=156977 RepID=A0ABU1SD15_9MICO|nr:HEAT repeat domain-containing protein [Microbacterium resistens]MDR6867493.1 HEAT repeat protein [Microbacterium resistens]